MLAGSNLSCSAARCRLFKFATRADFKNFQLKNAKWDDSAGGITAKHPSDNKGLGSEIKPVLVESPIVETNVPAGEIVVSWNSITPPGSYLHVYVRTRHGDFWSKRFTVAIWNRDNKPTQRTSLKLQKDMFGRMESDTLFLDTPADAFRVSAKLCSTDGVNYPTLRMLTVSAIATNPVKFPTRARKSAWGVDIPVPERSQLTVPDGNRFCSATSTAMVLDFWAQKLNRPELSVPLQTAVDGIYDVGWGGTGNWTFNTAYAAEFGGIRAYVTRFGSLAELEMWIAQELPVIVSVDYNKLRGRQTKQRMGHLMVLRGFTETGDPIFNDPYTFLDKGESVRKVFQRKNFERSWLTQEGSRGTVYLIYPDTWKIPRNKYGTW